MRHDAQMAYSEDDNSTRRIFVIISKPPEPKVATEVKDK
jgi:hypothetical protein